MEKERCGGRRESMEKEKCWLVSGLWRPLIRVVTFGIPEKVVGECVGMCDFGHSFQW